MSKTKKIVVYACKTHWDHHFPRDVAFSGQMPLFFTKKELESTLTCIKECGIVELEITLKKVVRDRLDP